MKFKIVADAACDIPDVYKDKFDITIVPIEVRFGDELYPEGMGTREFYQKVEQGDVIPKTSMPNAYKFENFLKDYANKDDVFVIAILISMELSPTKLQVQMAADNLGMKNIFIEESASATVGQGAIICELCKFIEKEQDIEKIKQEFYRLRDSMRIFAVVDDLKYLRASGRLSGASAALGKMLNVKPIISVQDGKILNIAKCMGTVKADNFIIDKMKNVDSSHPLYVVHSDTPENAARLRDKIKPLLPDSQEYIESEIGYVVGSHVGPKCYGFGYFEKQ